MTTLADLELIANISSAYDTLKSRVVVALRTQIGDAVQLGRVRSEVLELLQSAVQVSCL